MPVLQVSEQLKPARPERLVLAVPVSAQPLPVRVAALRASAGEADWTAARATAAYSLLSTTPSLLRMHLARAARA